MLGLLEEARQLPLGRVCLAAAVTTTTTTTGEHVLPPFLAAFRARFLEAEVVLEVGNRSRV